MVARRKCIVKELDGGNDNICLAGINSKYRRTSLPGYFVPDVHHSHVVVVGRLTHPPVLVGLQAESVPDRASRRVCAEHSIQDSGVFWSGAGRVDVGGEFNV